MTTIDFVSTELRHAIHDLYPDRIIEVRMINYTYVILPPNEPAD